MENLTHLRDDYATIEDIFDNGLHEFVIDYLASMRQLAGQIALDYRFRG